MTKELATGFNTRQHMNQEDFELFYYRDIDLSHVSVHAHDHYEFYFFLEGGVDYQIGSRIYHLEPGDYLLIPPGIRHNADSVDSRKPYRRFIFWFSQPFFSALCQLNPEGYGYAFRHAEKKEGCHFRPASIHQQEILSLLMNLLEEKNQSRPFKELSLELQAKNFLLYLNRLTYDQLNHSSPSHETALYLGICDYINQHLEGDLSLDQLASCFFVSKYHISHVFKDSMGISIHQYILKKRLHACKNAILSGMAFTKLYEQYGFHDYTVFYRAFKKEFGVSPTEYKERHATEQLAVSRF